MRTYRITFKMEVGCEGLEGVIRESVQRILAGDSVTLVNLAAMPMPERVLRTVKVTEVRAKQTTIAMC